MTVNSVPITVESTTADYFVLYVTFGTGRTESRIPVAVTRGESGTTTLIENITGLPADRYRVEKYSIDDPADVDGDCVDDISELSGTDGNSPVNPAPGIASSDGAASLDDASTVTTLSRDQAGKRFMKLVFLDFDTDNPGVYFLNTNTHTSHSTFLDSQNIDTWDYYVGSSKAFTGDLVFDPNLVAYNGSAGSYYLRFGSAFYYNHADLRARAYTLLAANMAVLTDNLHLHIPSRLLDDVKGSLPALIQSRIDVLFDEDLVPPPDFVALNESTGYGRLRQMSPDDTPHPRDIVIYDVLPNELPRVAGIVSTVRQTPLSHVNLRASQNGIPNAYVRDVLDDPDVVELLDNFVRLQVGSDSYSLRAATPAEVAAHYSASRPSRPQTPARDLSVTTITPLSQVGFNDWDAFGVKAANVAVLGTLGFPEGTVPEGYAIPFYFYDEFMKANSLYDDVTTMLADSSFQTDFDVQADELKDLRDAIKDADTPEWITEALTAMHGNYPEGQSLRYRSSTNNEDLPSFNGAGLYDSKTQHADEEPLSKSLKQVFASLWTFRAFTEREVHRIDHLSTAMGVLVHPNYSNELANGVAVSFDPVRETDDNFYVNTQLGEDLVTNPDAHSVPEEILLNPSGDYRALSTSNLLDPGKLLMSPEQMRSLRQHLQVIHDHFKQLYSPASNKPFAMEIEFKITEDNVLAIKQARPWVFRSTATSTSSSSAPVRPPVFGGGGGGGGGFGGGGGGGGGGGAPEPEPDPEPTLAEIAERATTRFDDVTLGAYYAAPVGWMLRHAVTAGCAESSFCAHDTVNRRQFVTFLWGSAGRPEPINRGSQLFDDVSEGSGADAAIGWAAETGITVGCQSASDSAPALFCPRLDISRAQIAVFLYRYVEAEPVDPEARFSDVDPDAYYAEAVAWMAHHGITTGCADDAFCPSKPSSRAQAATFIFRTAQTPAAWGADDALWP